jgi:CRP/FNR family cyclic AMP-dependent transcriptional regulator
MLSGGVIAMASSITTTDFIVWGIDQTAYGPVELPTLVDWVKDERVTADTWVFAARTSSWQKAAQVPELQMFFRPRGGGPVASVESVTGIDPRALRRVKILAGMTDEQLERFTQFMEVEKIPQWSVIVKQGDRGDTMYLILQGELRVRINVSGKETILTTLTVGEFFGDISLFDQGPRSADVVANAESIVVKISSNAFEQLAKEAPDIATPFLLAIGKTLTARIRADNKRYGDSVKFARAAQ